MFNLNKIFDELWDAGYIYDEDENGRGMSYGEICAVDDYLWESLIEELNSYNNIIEKIDAYNNIIKNAVDDVWLFMSIDEDDAYVWIDYDEYNNTIDYSNIPEMFREELEMFIIENDIEKVA